MKFNIAYPKNGTQKTINIDDDKKWGKLMDKKMGQEFDGEFLGEEFKGYIFRINGGSDNDGFAMIQGILVNSRKRIVLKPGSKGFKCRRTGAKRRKGVRGCVVGPDIAVLDLSIVKKGEKEIEGVTDVSKARRLGPKRANKIRKLFVLPRHSDNLRSTEEKKEKVTVNTYDVCKYVVKRISKEVADKKYYKSPKIQRLVTAERIRRKKQLRDRKIEKVKRNKELETKYFSELKDNRRKSSHKKN